MIMSTAIMIMRGRADTVRSAWGVVRRNEKHPNGGCFWISRQDDAGAGKFVIIGQSPFANLHPMRLTIRVSPNASKTEIAGREGGILRIRLAAPPVDGKANEKLIEFLADEFDVPKSSVRIVSGGTSKTKIVELP
jgi:uncharacterized protein